MPNFHQRGAFSFSPFLLHLITHPPTFVRDLALSACFIFVCGELVLSSLLLEIEKSLSFSKCLHICSSTNDRIAPSSNALHSNTLLSNNHLSLPHFHFYLYIKSEFLFPSPDAIPSTQLSSCQNLFCRSRHQPDNQPSFLRTTERYLTSSPFRQKHQ